MINPLALSKNKPFPKPPLLLSDIFKRTKFHQFEFKYKQQYQPICKSIKKNPSQCLELLSRENEFIPVLDLALICSFNLPVYYISKAPLSKYSLSARTKHVTQSNLDQLYICDGYDLPEMLSLITKLYLMSISGKFTFILCIASIKSYFDKLVSLRTRNGALDKTFFEIVDTLSVLLRKISQLGIPVITGNSYFQKSDQKRVVPALGFCWNWTIHSRFYFNIHFSNETPAPSLPDLILNPVKPLL